MNTTAWTATAIVVSTEDDDGGTSCMCPAFEINYINLK